jgi:hypothetical protein
METRLECLTRRSLKCPSGLFTREIWELITLQQAEVGRLQTDCEKLEAEIEGLIGANGYQIAELKRLQAKVAEQFEEIKRLRGDRVVSPSDELRPIRSNK